MCARPRVGGTIRSSDSADSPAAGTSSASFTLSLKQNPPVDRRLSDSSALARNPKYYCVVKKCGKEFDAKNLYLEHLVYEHGNLRREAVDSPPPSVSRSPTPPPRCDAEEGLSPKAAEAKGGPQLAQYFCVVKKCGREFADKEEYLLHLLSTHGDLSLPTYGDMAAPHSPLAAMQSTYHRSGFFPSSFQEDAPPGMSEWRVPIFGDPIHGSPALLSTLDMETTPKTIRRSPQKRRHSNVSLNSEDIPPIDMPQSILAAANKRRRGVSTNADRGTSVTNTRPGKSHDATPMIVKLPSPTRKSASTSKAKSKRSASKRSSSPPSRGSSRKYSRRSSDVGISSSNSFKGSRVNEASSSAKFVAGHLPLTTTEGSGRSSSFSTEHDRRPPKFSIPKEWYGSFAASIVAGFNMGWKKPYVFPSRTPSPAPSNAEHTPLSSHMTWRISDPYSSHTPKQVAGATRTPLTEDNATSHVSAPARSSDFMASEVASKFPTPVASPQLSAYSSPVSGASCMNFSAARDVPSRSITPSFDRLSLSRIPNPAYSVVAKSLVDAFNQNKSPLVFRSMSTEGLPVNRANSTSSCRGAHTALDVRSERAFSESDRLSSSSQQKASLVFTGSLSTYDDDPVDTERSDHTSTDSRKVRPVHVIRGSVDDAAPDNTEDLRSSSADDMKSVSSSVSRSQSRLRSTDDQPVSSMSQQRFATERDPHKSPERSQTPLLVLVGRTIDDEETSIKTETRPSDNVKSTNSVRYFESNTPPSEVTESHLQNEATVKTETSSSTHKKMYGDAEMEPAASGSTDRTATPSEATVKLETHSRSVGSLPRREWKRPRQQSRSRSLTPPPPGCVSAPPSLRSPPVPENDDSVSSSGAASSSTPSSRGASTNVSSHKRQRSDRRAAASSTATKHSSSSVEKKSRSSASSSTRASSSSSASSSTNSTKSSNVLAAAAALASKKSSNMKLRSPSSSRSANSHRRATRAHHHRTLEVRRAPLSVRLKMSASIGFK